MIRFRVLGGVELHDPSGQVLHSVLAQPKRLALLAYLSIASPVGFHRRDKLLGLFWPELDDERARAALNQAIYHLRRSLGRDVVMSRGPGDLGVNSARLWCDAVAFEQALEAGASHEALEFYRGDLLTGFFLPGALEWERWLEDERARLRASAAAGTWLLAEAAAARGTPADAASWGRRSVALTSGDEPRLRQLIALLDRLGDRIGAVRVYEEVVEQWARDAEIEPSAETLDLIQKIKSRERASVNASAITFQASVTEPSESNELRVAPPGARPELNVQRAGKFPTMAIGYASAALLLMVLMAFLIWPQSARLNDSLPTGNVVVPDGEAYAEYQKGRHFLAKLDAEATGEAREHFERSLDLDPSFAGAWGGLSEAFIQLTSLMVLPAREGYSRARAAAERALELDPELAEAHGGLAMVLSMYYWDTDAAERHFRRAVALDPGSARTRQKYAAHLRNLGRFEESLVQIRQAQRLDPFIAFAHIEEGITLYVARRNDEALQKFQQYLAVSPGDTHAYVFLAMVHSQLGQYEEALAALRVTDPQMTRPDAQTVRGVIYARIGRLDEARRMLETLDKLQNEGRPVSAFHKAAIYAALGDHDHALDLLEQAAEQPTWQLRLLKVTPTWDPLRQHPRFQALLTKVGLPQ